MNKAMDKKEISKTSNKQNNDALLSCLSYITGCFNEKRSEESLAEFLPETKENKITIDMFCRAAKKVNLDTEIISKPIKKIDHAVCPFIAIMTNGDACVVLGFIDKNQVTVVFPASKSGINSKAIPIKDLQEGYSGKAILIKQEYATNQALNKTDDDKLEFSGHWFWQVIWENKFIYSRVAIAAFFINLFVLASPIFIMNVYDRVLPNNAIDTGWALAIGITGIFIFDLLLKILRGYFIDVAGRRGDVIWTRRLYDHILDMQTDARSEPVGAFAGHMREFEHIREFFTSATLAAVIDFPFALLFMFCIWMLGGIVALVPFTLFFLILIIGILLQIPVKSLVKKSFKSSEEKQSILIESLNGLETIKGCGATRHFRGSYGRYTAENAIWGQKSRWWSGLSVNLAGFFQQLSTVGVVLLGMYLVQDGEMTVGALIACVILGGRALAPIAKAASLINKYHQATNALKTLNRVMRMPTERPKSIRFLHRPKLNGIFGVEDVSFSYPNAQVPALQDLNFAIHAGERVGIVGRIGSGKSTLIKLLMKFHLPSKGVIRLDGTDIQQIDPIDLRKNISYLGQDTKLFRGTVRENIALGSPSATDEEILKAAQLSGAHNFIRLHPLGYDAPIGENGAGLSGGQKQAIAIARSLIGDPAVLICDEPTNEMDSASESLLINSLKTWLDEKKRGLVIVTHRFSLLNIVDRLIVIDQGKIIMDGPKEQVLDKMNQQNQQSEKQQVSHDEKD